MKHAAKQYAEKARVPERNEAASVRAEHARVTSMAIASASNRASGSTGSLPTCASAKKQAAVSRQLVKTIILSRNLSIGA